MQYSLQCCPDFSNFQLGKKSRSTTLLLLLASMCISPKNTSFVPGSLEMRQQHIKLDRQAYFRANVGAFWALTYIQRLHDLTMKVVHFQESKYWTKAPNPKPAEIYTRKFIRKWLFLTQENILIEIMEITLQQFCASESSWHFLWAKEDISFFALISSLLQFVNMNVEQICWVVVRHASGFETVLSEQQPCASKCWRFGGSFGIDVRLLQYFKSNHFSW